MGVYLPSGRGERIWKVKKVLLSHFRSPGWLGSPDALSPSSALCCPHQPSLQQEPAQPGAALIGFDFRFLRDNTRPPGCVVTSFSLFLLHYGCSWFALPLSLACGSFAFRLSLLSFYLFRGLYPLGSLSLLLSAFVLYLFNPHFTTRRSA